MGIGDNDIPAVTCKFPDYRRADTGTGAGGYKSDSPGGRIQC
jgi:hypothetical protein